MHKIKDCDFGKTKSAAIIIHNPVPARLALRVTFWSSWHSQQQHPQPQQHTETASSSVWKKMRGISMQNEDRVNKGDTTDNQCSPSIWKQMRDTESSVGERPKFEIGLRVEGYVIQ